MLETLLGLIFSVLIAFASGYGVVKFLLPAELKEYRFIFMVPIGYGIICWGMDIISILFGLTLLTSVKFIFPLLLGLSILAYFIKPHDTVNDLFKGLSNVFLLALPMCLFILWPLFYIGADTFQASVNADWLYSLGVNNHLKEHPVVLSKDDMHHYPLEQLFFRDASISSYEFFQGMGHYAGSYYAVLIESLLMISEVNALSLTTALFFFSMPLGIYLLVRIAFNQSFAVGILSVILFGISSPISLSFIYYLLPLFFIGLTLLFIAFTQPTLKTSIFTALVLSMLASLYSPLLPFVGFPIILLLSYKLVMKELDIAVVTKASATIILLFLFVELVTHFSHLDQLFATLSVMKEDISDTSSLSMKHFSILLTERVIPVFLGLYPLMLLDTQITLIGTFSLIAIIGILSSLLYWGLSSKNNLLNYIYYMSCLAVFIIFWWHFTFNKEVGLAIFKLITWFSFLISIACAIGLYFLWHKITQSRLYSKVLWAFITGIASLGAKSGIVSVPDFSGNQDYPNLPKDLAQHVSPQDTIGLVFANLIQQKWVAYYLRDYKVHMLNQHTYPSNYEELYNKYDAKEPIDVSIKKDNPSFSPYVDYYLTWKGTDIIEKTQTSPVWENDTFQLYAVSNTPDFAFIGRGYYRAESVPNENLSYWQPTQYAWTSKGGEIYLLNPSQPQQPYVLSFMGSAGWGTSNKRRIIELWHNKQKFDELELNNTGRIFSQPFYPTANVNLLTIKVKDNVNQMQRKSALWNKEVPVDYRRLNLMVSRIEIYHMEKGIETELIALDKVINGKNIFSYALKFNGISRDNWLQDKSSISFIRPKNAKFLIVGFLLPGGGQFELPYEFEYNFNGRSAKMLIDKPGYFGIGLPLDASQGEDNDEENKKEEPKLDTLTIQPSQTYTVNDAGTEYENSLRLEMVTYTSKDALATENLISP